MSLLYVLRVKKNVFTPHYLDPLLIKQAMAKVREFSSCVSRTVLVTVDWAVTKRTGITPVCPNRERLLLIIYCYEKKTLQM